MAGGKFVQKLLDMADAARLSRAKRMEFDVENIRYHGTTKEFDEFDDEMIGSNYGMEEPGHYFSDTREEALGGLEIPSAGRVVEAYLPKNLYEVDVRGKGDAVSWWDTQEKQGWMDEAIDEGFEGVRVVGDKNSFTVIPDATRIRSPKAAFDPEKKDSANLLASTLPAAIGIGSLSQSDIARAERLEELADLAAQEGDEEVEILALQEMKKMLGSLPGNMAQTQVQQASQRAPDVGGIQPAQSNMLGKAADAADQYNKFRQERLAPVAEMMLPVGELPEEVLRKMSYGDKISYLDAVKAMLGLL